MSGVLGENIPTETSREEAYKELASRLEDMRMVRTVLANVSDFDVIEEHRDALEGFGVGDLPATEDDMTSDGHDIREEIARAVDEWPLHIEPIDEDGWISVVMSTGGPQDEFCFRGDEVVFVFLPWGGREEIRLSGDDADVAREILGPFAGIDV